jgi:KaiC/GvpD/RAD55 family RecA-like ATPase
MVSTGLEELDHLLSGGYPDKSGILVEGPPGVGKEALGYQFISSGIPDGDFCLYVTRLGMSEVLHDTRAFGVDLLKGAFWLAGRETQIKCDVNDLQGLSVNVKDIIRKNTGRRIRVVTDVLSSLLVLNPPDTIYRFLSQLLTEVKQHDAVFLATIEEGMHQPQVLAAMEQLFDGVMELRLYEEGLRIMPLLRVRKMRGIPPQPTYFRFSFSQGKMEISPHAH